MINFDKFQLQLDILELNINKKVYLEHLDNLRIRHDSVNSLIIDLQLNNNQDSVLSAIKNEYNVLINICQLRIENLNKSLNEKKEQLEQLKRPFYRKLLDYFKRKVIHD